MMLQYHTKNKTCSFFSIHLYHNNMHHWSSYYQIMQTENHGVLELVPARKNMKKIYKVMSNCQFSIRLVQIIRVYTEYTTDYCDSISSMYLPTLVRYGHYWLDESKIGCIMILDNYFFYIAKTVRRNMVRGENPEFNTMYTLPL